MGAAALVCDNWLVMPVDFRGTAIYRESFLRGRASAGTQVLSDEYFTLNRTLLEAWAGQQSFRRIDNDQWPPAAATSKGSNPTIQFQRPEATLARKSRGASAVLARCH